MPEDSSQVVSEISRIIIVGTGTGYDEEDTVKMEILKINQSLNLKFLQMVK